METLASDNTLGDAIIPIVYKYVNTCVHTQPSLFIYNQSVYLPVTIIMMEASLQNDK